MKIQLQPDTSNSSLIKGMSWLAEKIYVLEAWVSQIPGKGLEVIAMALYAIAHLLMAIVHEPWYDEAVAWQIARCASITDILFEIPHYEGHPPLWHLILMPFAKLGVGYEFSLSLVSLIFAGAAVGLIIWKAPFPRIVRLLLPFTYFFFYQYGVISRPYCVMMLAFMLLAICYPKRDERPGRYTLCLMLLCLTSAYGIVLAGGLAMVWCWEILKQYSLRKLVKSAVKDQRIWWLAGLLLLALLLVATIVPRGDTCATNPLVEEIPPNNIFVRMIYMLTASLSDVLLSNAYWDYNFLKNTFFYYSTFVSAVAIGCIILVGLVLFGRRRKNIGIFFVPYLLFGVFSSLVYFCLHHTGIILLLLIFYFWISVQNTRIEDSKSSLQNSNANLIKNFAYIGVAISLCISLAWSVSSIIMDIRKDYAIGRNIANFISSNHLDDYLIMAEWSVVNDEKNETVMNTEYYIYTDNVAPYFEHNIFYNVMGGKDELNYCTHTVATEAENQKNLEQWKAMGYPDVLYGNPALDVLWDNEECSYKQYQLVYLEPVERIWKTDSQMELTYIYVRKELADELGLEAIDFWERLKEIRNGTAKK